jgi:hypothetical protein
MSASKLPALKHSLGLVLAALFGLLLAGCSTSVRLGYNQADTLVNWFLSDYVDLDPHQRDLFDQKFRTLQAWHRREQLPQYARLLRETRQRAQDGLTREDVLWVMERSRTQIEVLVRQGASDAAEVMVTLTPDQLTTLEQSFVRANRKFVREWAVSGSIDEQKRVRAERLVVQVERFTGRLSKDQSTRIAALSDALPMTTDQRYVDRQRRQRELIATLRSGRSRNELAAWLRDWAPNWERGRSEAYAQASRVSAEQRAQIYAEIDRMLTPAQRTRAITRLQGYIDDFEALSGAVQAGEQPHRVAY